MMEKGKYLHFILGILLIIFLFELGREIAHSNNFYNEKVSVCLRNGYDGYIRGSKTSINGLELKGYPDYAVCYKIIGFNKQTGNNIKEYKRFNEVKG